MCVSVCYHKSRCDPAPRLGLCALHTNPTEFYRVLRKSFLLIKCLYIHLFNMLRQQALQRTVRIFVTLPKRCSSFEHSFFQPILMQIINLQAKTTKIEEKKRFHLNRKFFSYIFYTFCAFLMLGIIFFFRAIRHHFQKKKRFSKGIYCYLKIEFQYQLKKDSTA